MRMSHVYQPVMIRELLDRGGRASRQDIARALLNEDRRELDYYREITRDMVGRVLLQRGVARRAGATWIRPTDRSASQRTEGRLRAKTCPVCGQAWRRYLGTPTRSYWLH